MKYFYPHAIARLRVIWESFGDSSNPLLQRPYEVFAQPRRVTVNVNSYVEADTFELDFDFKTFPFDPRTIRSCQVTIYADNLDALGDPKTALVPSDDKALFEGFADEDQMTLDDSTRTVKLKGRDFTALLIDAKWPGTLLPLTQPVDVVIAGILAKLPSIGNIKVDNRTDTPALPVLGAFYPQPGLLAGRRSAQKHEKYWDVIQDVCSRSGLICYMELGVLVLDRPRTLYDPNKSVQFVYGKNLKSIEFTRKFGRQKGFNLVVRSVKDKGVIVAEIPKDSTRLPEGGDYVYVPIQTPQGVMVQPGNPASKAPTMSFVVANVTSKAHLIEVGEKIYEEIGRQQIEGRMKTFDMDAPSTISDDGSGDIDADGCFNLLKLHVATPLQVVIGTDDLAAISAIGSGDLNGLTSDSVAKRTKYLTDRGYSLDVATIFAQTLGKFTTPFYTKSVQFTLDAEQGFSVEIDFVNFIETANKGLGIV